MQIRKIGLVSRTYKHVNRYRQILTALARYGFGDLVDRLKIGQYIEIGLQLISRRAREHVEKLSRAERVRLVLEELGPTFIKLGQVLSTRPDLIAAEFIAEFEKLQDAVPPFPFEQAKEIVESELRQPLDKAFARFDEAALAAASIGQVHRAQLRNGEEVVVKVQRPGIRQVIEIDLEILLHLATLLERHVEEARLHRPTKIVEEFGRVMEQELDYKAELAHLERFAGQFLNDSTVYVPKVYRDFSTGRVLTMEYVEGVNVSDLDALAEHGLDRKRIATRGAELILKQVFVHGFFHADPHPGNVFILPGDVICYLDFGMVGRLDQRCREDFADLVYGAAARDGARTTTALLRLTEHDEDVEPDPRAIERDVAELIDRHVLAVLLQQILQLISRHRLRIPADLVTMLKALATVESLGVRLDPELDMIKQAEPYVRKLKFERFSPRRIISDLYDSGADLLQLAREVPGGIREMLKLARRGSLGMSVEHRGLERVLQTHEHTANRISFAIVVAALIVGSSLIVLSGVPPKLGEIPVIGLLGFIIAAVMGLLLLISIIRHGRM
jgi:ubiquinone biosynthesis protein